MDCLFVPAKLQKVSELTDMNGYNRRFSVHNCPDAHPKWLSALAIDLFQGALPMSFLLSAAIVAKAVEKKNLHWKIRFFFKNTLKNH